jgi:hypothetical protein
MVALVGAALDVEADAALFRLLDPLVTEVADVDEDLFLISGLLTRVIALSGSPLMTIKVRVLLLLSEMISDSGVTDLLDIRFLAMIVVLSDTVGLAGMTRLQEGAVEVLVGASVIC